MPLYLSNLRVLFCENNKKTPGVFKVFLFPAEFVKNKSNLTVA